MVEGIYDDSLARYLWTANMCVCEVKTWREGFGKGAIHLKYEPASNTIGKSSCYQHIVDNRDLSRVYTAKWEWRLCCKERGAMGI